ncbi:MAG: hypothetical protein HY232_14360 [Acidobacteria bacterium]|nr:hypothetical protein [Acidobacteriota bacterium]
MGNIASTGQWIAFSPPTVPPDDVAMGYLIFLAGSFALHAGLQWLRPIGSEDAVPSRLTLRGGRLGWLILLWAIGLWSVWSPEWVIPLGAPGRIFQWAPIAALSAFALTPRAKLGLSRSSFTFVLGTGTTGLFAANLMSYSKSYIMFSLIPLLWLFVVHRSLRRWLPIMGFAFVAFYLFVVAPIVMTARLSPLRPNESPAEHLANTFDVWRSEGIQFASNSYFGDQIDAFLMRQFDPIAVSFIIGEVKTYGLQLGSTAAYAAYAFIPRILWPEKPAVTRGAWFAYYVGFAPSEEESTMSLGITATGELYWNFGVAGVVVGMFTLGCLMGLLWRMAGADPRGNPLYMLLYVITMLSMVNMSEAVTVLVTVAVAFLTFKAAFIALSLLRRPDRRPHVVFTT